MSNYVKATDFEVKDGLLTGDPSKVIKGSEINDEFNAIQTAIATKADLNSPSFIGNPTAPTQPNGNNSTRLATTAFVFQNSVPIGAILMWSGSIASIPSGYALCDGTNGTPDLRDRFVVGAGNLYTVNATGGSRDAVVVSHTHTAVAVGDHTHAALRNPNGSIISGANFQGGVGFGYDTPSGAGGAHTHTINSTGVSGTNANLPPYYALALIQRIS